MKARTRKKIHELVDFIIDGKSDPEDTNKQQYFQLDVLRFAIALENDILFKQLCEWHDQGTIQQMLEESTLLGLKWFQELFFAKWVELSGYSDEQLVEGVAITQQTDIQSPPEVQVLTAYEFLKENDFEEIEAEKEPEDIDNDMTEKPDSSKDHWKDYWKDLNDDLEFGDNDMTKKPDSSEDYWEEAYDDDEDENSD